MLFKDVLLKTKYYKEEIEKDLIRKGLYDDSVMDRLDRIDRFLALYNHKTVNLKQEFDVKAFNQGMVYIHKDLQILLQLLETEIIREHQDLKAYAETNLQHLEQLMAYYQDRHQYEMMASHLGHTVFYQNSGFYVQGTTGTTGTRVPLGQVNLTTGRRISASMEVDNVQYRYLRLRLENDHETHYLPAYEHFGKFIIIPGDRQNDYFEFEKPENHPTDQPVVFQIDHIPDNNNQYFLFAGKNKVTVGEGAAQHFEQVRSNKAILIEEDSTVSFWATGGTFLSFSFTKKPEKTNFGQEYQQALDPEMPRLFHMDVSAGTGVQFSTDAVFYAVRQQPVIINDYFTAETPPALTHFMVQTIYGGDVRTYDATLEIQDHYVQPSRIKHVAVKQL